MTEEDRVEQQLHSSGQRDTKFAHLKIVES
jgi:hypothetical protein